MVEDAIEDPTRIAQLLASELTGLSVGPLGSVAVVDADEDATPSADGTRAYSVAVEDIAVGAVELFPDAAVLTVHSDADAAIETATVDAGPSATRRGLAVEHEGEALRLSISIGAAVKPAVDVLRSAVVTPES